MMTTITAFVKIRHKRPDESNCRKRDVVRGNSANYLPCMSWAGYSPGIYLAIIQAIGETWLGNEGQGLAIFELSWLCR